MSHRHDPAAFGKLRHMETQHEFIERRRLAHEKARAEAENDPLIRELFGPKTPYVPSERELRAFCYEPGFMFRRQAGGPIDAPVSVGDTVTAVTDSSRVPGRVVSKNRRRRYPLRWFRTVRRALLRLQQYKMSPAP